MVVKFLQILQSNYVILTDHYINSRDLPKDSYWQLSLLIFLLDFLTHYFRHHTVK